MSARGFFADDTNNATTYDNNNNNSSEEVRKENPKDGSELRDRMKKNKKVNVSKLMGVYKKQASDVVGEFADTTSTHGLSRIHRYHSSKSYLMFLFWVGVFVLCSYYCGRGIYLQVQLYMDNPVTTSTSLIRLDKMPFPDIKLCPLLPYNKTRFRMLAEEFGMASVFDSPFLIPKQQMIELITAMGPNHTYVREQIQRTAFTFKEVVVDCRFGGVRCTDSTFKVETVFDHVNGNCFLLSTNQTQIKPGQGYGASFMIWTSLSESLTTDLFSDETGMGTRVIIGDSSDSLPPTMGALTASMTQATFHISRTDYIDNTSNRKCLSSPPTSKYTLSDTDPTNNNNNNNNNNNSQFRYSPQTCIASCITFEVRKFCNCTSYIDCITSGAEVFACVNKQEVYRNALNVCNARNECGELCETKKYTSQVSMSLWPSEPVVNTLTLEFVLNGVCNLGEDVPFDQTFDFCKNEFSTSLQKVDISFADFSYNEFTRDNQFTLEQLMSQVGGLTGLFIGSSFMSIVELFEMILLVFAVHTARTHKVIKKRVSARQLRGSSAEAASNAAL